MIASVEVYKVSKIICEVTREKTGLSKEELGGLLDARRPTDDACRVSRGLWYCGGWIVKTAFRRSFARDLRQIRYKSLLQDEGSDRAGRSGRALHLRSSGLQEESSETGSYVEMND